MTVGIELTIFMSYLQNKLKQIMNTRKLSQKDLAKLGKVSTNAISKWVNGISCPKIETLEPLAKALNLPVGDLIGDFGNKENLTEADKKFIALPNNKKQLLLKILQDIEEGL